MPCLPSCSDYSTSIVDSRLVKASLLAGGKPELHNNKPIKYAGGFCIVFPYITPHHKYAVRCWHASINNAKNRTKIISEYIKDTNLPYFVSFDYVDEGIITPMGIQPIVVMDWIEAQPLKEYIEANLHDSETIMQLANRFYAMTCELHEHHISHGDLQHGNIMVKNDGSIVLVDYDSMYVPKLDGWPDEISGLAGYQHPSRWENKRLSPKADYFSELIIFTSLCALAESPNLWDELSIKDTDTLLFSKDDINSKGSTHIFDRIRRIEKCEYLIEQIIDALNCSKIDDIIPLNTTKEDIVEELSQIWQDNGFVKEAFEKNEISRITNKW